MKPPSPLDVYGWYGRNARAYDAAVELAFLGQIPAWRRRAIEALRLHPGDRVLDLASGTGANIAMLEAAVGPGGSVVALDLSAEMLAAARSQLQDARQVEFVEADATRVPLPGGPIDAALCTLGLSVIPDHRAAIGAVRHALRPGGVFVVLDSAHFEGFLRFLNPIRDLGFRLGAAAVAAKDIVKGLEDEFDTVEVNRFFGGSMFIARCTAGS